MKLSLSGKVVCVEEMKDGIIISKILIKPGIRYDTIGDDLWVKARLPIGQAVTISVDYIEEKEPLA